MAVYMVANINIHDRSRYSQYEAGFMDIFTRYHGTMLTVDDSPQCLEGEWAFNRTVLIEFPDTSSAMDWYNSDEYQTLAQHRFAASVANIALLG